MKFLDSFIIVFLITILNIVIFLIFKKYLHRKENEGMKFLTLNIFKDLLWLIISLLIIDKTKPNFLLIVICFIASSFLIYRAVIRQINKS